MNIADIVIEKLPIELQGNRVLVAIVPVRSVTEKGVNLVLPDTMSEQKKLKTMQYDEYPFQGIVVAVGNKASLIKNDRGIEESIYKVGDLVYLDGWVDFDNFDREGFLYAEREYACVRDMQIAAVVRHGVTVGEYNRLIGESNRVKKI